MEVHPALFTRAVARVIEHCTRWLGSAKRLVTADIDPYSASPDRINHRGLLADEQMASAVKHQAALLLGVFVSTKRVLARETASQIASASVMSFFCRLT
jgi:hypothetical protein